MTNSLSEQEELLLRSWDTQGTGNERATLSSLIQRDPILRKQSDHYQKIREMLVRSEPDTFGPFFAERMLHVIKQRSQEIDYLIFFFFKKYQMVMVGVVVALLITNLVFTEQLTLKSLFGVDEQPAEDVFAIDLYNNIIQ